MIKTYIKFAWRSIRRHPGFSLLNIGGLTLGIAAAFIILVYAWQELSTDKSIPANNRIYRVATDFFDMGGFAKAQRQLHDRLVEYNDVETATAFDRGYQEIEVETGNTEYREAHYFTADSNFFKVFPRHFIEGSAQQVLRNPDDIVLTEKLARKYFGNQPAFGKIIRIAKERTPYRVSGVVSDMGQKTHLLADFWIPLEPPDEKRLSNWNQANVYNYVKLRPGKDAADLDRVTDDILRQYVYDGSRATQSFEQWKNDPKSVRFMIQPLTDIYLYSNYKFEIAPGGNPTQVYILAIIGFFIVLITAVNYVNLTTARASVRAKEVGIKKTLGANKSSLIRQFLFETCCTGIMAMLLSAVLAQGLVTLFNYLSGTSFISVSLLSGTFLAVLFVFVLLVSLLAGLYPAFYLTAFRPRKILKGDFTIKSNKNFRSSLVVFQFTLAIGLIIATLVVYDQLQFIQKKDKGFDDEGVLLVNNAGALGNKKSVFRQAIDDRSEVISTSFTQRTPGGKSVWMYTYQTPEMTESMTLQTFPADENYISTLGMHLLQGRNFSDEIASDSASVILNEEAVRALQLDNPIGAEVNEGQKVIGVISDFNFQSLHEKIAPAVIAFSSEGYQLAIKIKGVQHLAGFREFLEKEWKKLSADEPIQFSFLDEDFAAFADSERVLSKAVTFFTVLALIIAAIGLFALAMFSIEQKVKEIGIRKVLGAGTVSIVVLLSKDFIKLVLIAAVLAFPLAWWAMNNWLEDFAYRISLNVWVFISGAAIALFIALATISFQAIRAAVANPVKSLRTE